MRRVHDHSPRRDPDDEPERFRECLREANLPERYWRSTPSHIQRAELREWVERQVASEKEWLSQGQGWYLMGDLNSGKSSIASIFLMDAVRRCERCLWLSVRDVPVARFREGDRGKLLGERLDECDLLVLDDLGSERFRLSSAAGAALEETARILYDRGRSLIVTANLSWRQLGEHYAAEAGPFVSVLRRMVTPYHVFNDQWPLEPM